MIKRRCYLAFLVWLPSAVLLIGCRADPRDQDDRVAGCVRGNPEDVYCRVSIVSLISSPEKYAGVSASVSGFMAKGVIPNALYLSRESWLSGDTASAISLGAGNEVVSRNMAAADANFVVVFGSIEAQAASGAGGPALRMNVERLVVLFEAAEMDHAEQKLKAVRE